MLAKITFFTLKFDAASRIVEVPLIFTSTVWIVSSIDFLALAIAAIFAIATVWHPSLSGLGGFGWIIGAVLGGLIHYILSGRSK